MNTRKFMYFFIYFHDFHFCTLNINKVWNNKVWNLQAMELICKIYIKLYKFYSSFYSYLIENTKESINIFDIS